MFLLLGMNDEHTQLDFSQHIVCKCCGKEGRLDVFEEYSVLRVFNIPTVRWNRKYYAIMSCCDARYDLDQETGDQIDAGTTREIHLDGLHFVGGRQPVCPKCGFSVQPDFDYCPKCGAALSQE